LRQALELSLPQKDMFLNAIFSIFCTSPWFVLLLSLAWLHCFLLSKQEQTFQMRCQGYSGTTGLSFSTHHGAGCMAFPRSFVEELYPRYFHNLRNHIVNGCWVWRHEWLGLETKTCT
jgi:hypothetical protein